MVIQSFSNPTQVSYHTTSTSCTCKDHEYRKHTCKHMRLATRIEQGRPTTVSAAKAARIERNRETYASYYRMTYMQFSEF